MALYGLLWHFESKNADDLELVVPFFIGVLLTIVFTIIPVLPILTIATLCLSLAAATVSILSTFIAYPIAMALDVISGHSFKLNHEDKNIFLSSIFVLSLLMGTAFGASVFLPAISLTPAHLLLVIKTLFIPLNMLLAPVIELLQIGLMVVQTGLNILKSASLLLAASAAIVTASLAVTAAFGLIFESIFPKKEEETKAAPQLREHHTLQSQSDHCEVVHFRHSASRTLFSEADKTSTLTTSASNPKTLPSR